jgi:BMFP domain-containing protein YqiC
MQTQNRLFDDLARVAGGAFGALAGLRNEIEEMVKQRLERLLADLDHVPREEFEAVKAMAEKARLEQEALTARVAALEAALAEVQKPRPKAKPKSVSKDADDVGDGC